MTKRLLLISSVLALALSTGCLFSKKNAQPKDNGSIVGENEQNFKKRWLDRRTAELTTAGTPAAAAQTQAEQEFRERYEFLGGAKK